MYVPIYCPILLSTPAPPTKASRNILLTPSSLTGPLNAHPQRRRSDRRPWLQQRPRRQSHLRLPPQIRHPHRARRAREIKRAERTAGHCAKQGHHHEVEDGQGPGQYSGQENEGKGGEAEEEGEGEGVMVI